MSVGFVFTNFNNTQFTEGAISSILASDAVNSPIIIVDNASNIEHVKLLKLLETDRENLTVIYNKKNIGYFAGLNVGIDYARLKFPSIEFWLVGNNDLIFPNNLRSQILGCQQILEQYPVVSPNIVTLDGLPQNPHVISKIRRFCIIVTNA